MLFVKLVKKLVVRSVIIRTETLLVPSMIFYAKRDRLAVEINVTTHPQGNNASIKKDQITT